MNIFDMHIHPLNATPDPEDCLQKWSVLLFKTTVYFLTG